MQTETIVQIAIPTILGVIMFTMGLGLTVADFLRIFEKPKAVLIGSFAQLVLLPSFAFLIASLVDVPAAIAIGLVLVACCPGGPSSNLMSNLAKGDTALSVTLTAVSGAVTIISIPFIVNLALSMFAGEATPKELPILRTNLQILAVVGVPVTLGMVIRHYRETLAQKSEKILKIVSVILLCVLVVGAAAKEQARILDFLTQAGPLVIGFNLATMTLGFTIARLLKLDKPQSVTITLEVGMQNAAMAISIAIGILDDTAIAIPAVIYGLWMYFSCAAVVFAGRRWVAFDDLRKASTVLEP